MQLLFAREMRLINAFALNFYACPVNTVPLTRHAKMHALSLAKVNTLQLLTYTRCIKVALLLNCYWL